MNRRQRWILQASLALAAALLAWRLGTQWQQAELRYAALSGRPERSTATLAVAPRREPVPVEEIAAKNLFSADRNNEVALPEPARPGPSPPVPTVLGTMKLGANYEALMSEAEGAGRGARRVKQGDQVGAYRVVEILADKVVVEYEGRTTALEIYQSARSVQAARTGTQQRTPTATPVTPPAPVVVGTGGPASSPAGASSAPARSQQVQEPGRPPGTRVFIEGNRRRLERDTPFGVQSWYEPLD